MRMTTRASGAGIRRSIRYRITWLDPFASSLNINLSSGILFNIASYLTYSNAQYVLRGVTVSDVMGTNNLDSVAFDAEKNSIDNQDGHNAFQDVVLSGLILSSDNGNAAKVYQAAGLGCSDSLRLLGMTNVTVMNSVLFDEAGCHTGTGTAAVILGRVSHVRFVNNIIFGVQASGSPDETGIDFEWSEDHVDLHGNLFAGNAGPAVEILNIHGGDHSSELDFSGNTFAQNAHSHSRVRREFGKTTRGGDMERLQGRFGTTCISNRMGSSSAARTLGRS